MRQTLNSLNNKYKCKNCLNSNINLGIQIKNNKKLSHLFLADIGTRLETDRDKYQAYEMKFNGTIKRFPQSIIIGVMKCGTGTKAKSDMWMMSALL